MLVREKHEVVLATNGIEAMRSLEQSAFALIITDLVMPGADGLELLRQLRKRPSRPKVIAMSGGGRGAGAQFLELAANLGAVATIEKPFTIDQLAGAVREIEEIAQQGS